MNSFEREKENKERRRVALWLAGGVTAIIAVGGIAVGSGAITSASASSADSYYSAPAVDTTPIISKVELTSFTHPVAKPSVSKPAAVSPQSPATSTPQSAMKPASNVTPDPTPAPVPTPSDDTDHDGHGDGDGHQHQTETDHSSSDHSSQTA